MIRTRNWLDACSLPAVACSLSTIVLSPHGTHGLATILTKPHWSATRCRHPWTIATTGGRGAGRVVAAPGGEASDNLGWVGSRGERGRPSRLHGAPPSAITLTPAPP